MHAQVYVLAKIMKTSIIFFITKIPLLLGFSWKETNYILFFYITKIVFFFLIININQFYNHV